MAPAQRLPQKCRWCDYQSSSNLVKHMKRVHKDRYQPRVPVQRRVICPECGQAKSYGAMGEHRRRLHGYQPTRMRGGPNSREHYVDATEHQSDDEPGAGSDSSNADVTDAPDGPETYPEPTAEADDTRPTRPDARALSSRASILGDRWSRVGVRRPSVVSNTSSDTSVGAVQRMFTAPSDTSSDTDTDTDQSRVRLRRLSIDSQTSLDTDGDGCAAVSGRFLDQMPAERMDVDSPQVAAPFTDLDSQEGEAGARNEDTHLDLDAAEEGPRLGEDGAVIAANDPERIAFAERAQEHADRSLRNVQATLASLSKSNRAVTKQTRDTSDDQICAEQVLSRVVKGIPILIDDYQELLDEDGMPKHVRFTHHYLVCTPEQARSTVDDVGVLIPILIPARHNDMSPQLTIDGLLDLLEDGKSVDVHFGDATFDTTGNYKHYQAKRCPTGQAVSKFHNPKYRASMNLLNIRCMRDNAIPSPLANNQPYNVLTHFSTHEAVGKETSDAGLGQCRSWHVLSRSGAWSTPHRDRHGMVTTTFIEDCSGDKDWIIYPELTLEQQLAYQKSNGDLMVLPQPFNIALSKGDTIIQPSCRMHAPRSSHDVLVTGTTRFDSRLVLESLWATLQERLYPFLTNEDEAEDYLPLMHKMVGLWARGSTRYPWADEDDLSKSKKLLKRLQMRTNAEKRSAEAALANSIASKQAANKKAKPSPDVSKRQTAGRETSTSKATGPGKRPLLVVARKAGRSRGGREGS